MARSLTRGAQRGSLHLVIFFFVCVGILALADAAPAAGPIVVKAQVIMTGPPAATLPAGDDPGHTVGMGQRRGMATFSDGRKADYSNVFFMDYFQGKFANTWGYTKMQFGDGSWLFFKWDAAFAGRDQAGRPTFAGTGKLLQGTGPYEGIQGSVKFKNQQIPPNKEYPQGATRADAEITYTLPEK